MRYARILLMFVLVASPLGAEEQPAGPASKPAQEAYNQGMHDLTRNWLPQALESFKKADKLDGGNCAACQQQIITYAPELGDWKAAEAAAAEMVAQAQDVKQRALAHYETGIIMTDEGMEIHKDSLLSRAHEEFITALALNPNFPMAVYSDGLALAHLNQDEAAKKQFVRYAGMVPTNDPTRQRALFFVSRPEMARARMAPLFEVTTLDGQHISLSDLQGKVVLLNFWTSWCGPCRDAIPHLQKIAKKYRGQPLVILSVSLDASEDAWKKCVKKYRMTWLNYRDGSIAGPVAKLFEVHEMPQFFFIDGEGVIQYQRIGDGLFNKKLRQEVDRARALRARENASVEGAKLEL